MAIVKLIVPTSNAPLQSEDDRASKMIAGMKLLLDSLPFGERDFVLQELIKLVQPIGSPRGGAVLSSVAKFISAKGEVSLAELKKHVSQEHIEAPVKEIYNALAYLTKTRKITRIGHGRYIIGGVGAVETSDDLGGEPSQVERMDAN